MQDASNRGQRIIYILGGGIAGAVVGYGASLLISAPSKDTESNSLVPATIAFVIGAIIGLAGIYGRRRWLRVVIGAALGVIIGMFFSLCFAYGFVIPAYDVYPPVPLSPFSQILLVIVWVITGLIAGCLFVLPILHFGAGGNDVHK